VGANQIKFLFIIYCLGSKQPHINTLESKSNDQSNIYSAANILYSFKCYFMCLKCTTNEAVLNKEQSTDNL